jgi:hypothetical protein
VRKIRTLKICQPVGKSYKNVTKGNIMREIKFRIWSEHSKRYYDKISDTWTWWEDGVTLSGSQDYMLLEQYTGLKDKNGKDIYEGDKDKNGYIVVYENGCFWLRDPISTFIVDQLFLLNSEIEIIGNIHEEKS